MKGFLVWWNLELWPRIDYAVWSGLNKWRQLTTGRKFALVLILFAFLLVSFRVFAHNEGDHAPPTSFDGYTILASPEDTHMLGCAPTVQENGLNVCYPFVVSPMNVVEIGDHGWCRLEVGGAQCSIDAEELLK